MAVQDFFNTLTIMQRQRVADGIGGYNESYVEVQEFNGAITTDSAVETIAASKRGVASVFTLTTTQDVNIQYNMVIKTHTNEYYRITTNPDEFQSPRVSSLNLKTCKCEKWKV